MDTGFSSRAQWLNTGNFGIQHVPDIACWYTLVLFLTVRRIAVAASVLIQQEFTADQHRRASSRKRTDK